MLTKTITVFDFWTNLDFYPRTTRLLFKKPVLILGGSYKIPLNCNVAKKGLYLSICITAHSLWKGCKNSSFIKMNWCDGNFDLLNNIQQITSEQTIRNWMLWFQKCKKLKLPLLQRTKVCQKARRNF